jgi:hypothetical protein
VNTFPQVRLGNRTIYRNCCMSEHDYETSVVVFF